MSTASELQSRVRPAQVNFLAIYNPTLGEKEGTERDQIVFFYSRTADARRKKKGKNAPSEEEVRKEENEQLRQVGLAQGMLNFAGGFSDGTPIDSIETEKHRIVLVEVEKDWWILASIDLTRLPSSKQTTSNQVSSQPQYEYSVREVSPPDLLIQQLFRAYHVFLLHHDTSLSALFTNLRTRDRFCNILQRYWTQFALTWDVMLHGNPAVEVYGGIKLSAGGELGIGVGEEDWGSGEREVLEGLIRNTEGLVDMMVSRYGDATDPLKPPSESRSRDGDYENTHQDQHWLGANNAAGPTDGIVFSGSGVIVSASLRDISIWAEDIYRLGDDAYGIRSNPTSSRGQRRRRRPPPKHEDKEELIKPSEGSTESSENVQGVRESAEIPMSENQKKDDVDEVTRPAPVPGIPPPIVSAAEASLKKATASADTHEDGGAAPTKTNEGESVLDPKLWAKYLKLGYGTAWGPSSNSQTTTTEAKHQASKKASPTRPAQNQSKKSHRSSVHDFAPKREPKSTSKPTSLPIRPSRPEGGYFLTGLRGNLDAPEDESSLAYTDDEAAEENSWSSRLSLRSLFVTIDASALDSASYSSSGLRSTKNNDPYTPGLKRVRLRVLIYAHRPFLYILLFEEPTPHLTIPSFYHDLHHHLTPLHVPLLRSTDPATVRARILGAQPQGVGKEPIFDLVYSPQNMTVRSSIPNIPAPGTMAAEGFPVNAISAITGAGWTRVEALSVHSRVLDLVAETRKRRPTAQTGDTGFQRDGEADEYEAADRDIGGRKGGYNLRVRPSERERTVKTSRGWWIVWLSVWTSSTSRASTIPIDREGDGEEAASANESGRRATEEHASGRRAGDAANPASTPAEEQQQPLPSPSISLSSSNLPPSDRQHTSLTRTTWNTLSPPTSNPAPSPRILRTTTAPTTDRRSSARNRPRTNRSHAEDDYKEALLIRKGGDAAGATGRRTRFSGYGYGYGYGYGHGASQSSSTAASATAAAAGASGRRSSLGGVGGWMPRFPGAGRFGIGGGGGGTGDVRDSAGAPEVAGADERLGSGRVGGIGVDARRYVEGVLSLNR